MRKEFRALFCFAILCLLPASALAGPPFVTDDADPVDRGKFEIYFYSEGTDVHDDNSGTLPGLEVNYGLFDDTQLSVEIPLSYEKGDGRGGHFNFGATSLSLKYRFVHEDEDGWRPEIATFPAVEIPVGDADKSVGGGRLREFLPIWAEKNFGAWQTFGGGGYWINPGPGNRDYWFFGWALMRQITPNFALGGEVFHQTKDSRNGLDSTGANIGVIYDFSDTFHLATSVGRGLQNAHSTNELSYYLGLRWTP